MWPKGKKDAFDIKEYFWRELETIYFEGVSFKKIEEPILSI